MKKTPGIFRSATLSLEIPDKMKLHSWKFHQIVLHPLEFLRPKTKTHGNFTLFFLDHIWKFHFFFYWLLELPYSIFLILHEISCPQPHSPPLFFFWNSPLEVVTASYTEICKLLIQQSTCFGQQDNEPKPYF